MLFLLGSLISGVATSSARFIAGLQNGAMTVIVAAAPLEKRPTLIGLVMGVCQMGLAGGPLIGGALTQFSTWRWCFYINFPIGGVAALLILLVPIPERRVRCDSSPLHIITSRFDLVGFVLFTMWSTMLLLALQFGGSKFPWSSPNVVGLFVGGFVAFLVFFWWQMRRGEGAMIPFHIIRKREIWTSCLCMACLATTSFAASYYLPIYFQAVLGVSPLTSGVYMLPSILGQLVFSVLAGVLIQRFGYYLPFAVVSSAILAIGYGLMSTFSPETEMVKWVAYQVIVGTGRGLGMQVSLVAVQANTAPDFIAIATATLIFCQTFGGAVFNAVANTIFNNTLWNELADRVSGAKAQAIIDVGASGLRSLEMGERDLAGVLASYAKGVDAVFYVVIAMALCMFILSWGIGWRDIRSKEASDCEGKK